MTQERFRLSQFHLSTAIVMTGVAGAMIPFFLWFFRAHSDVLAQLPISFTVVFIIYLTIALCIIGTVALLCEYVIRRREAHKP